MAEKEASQQEEKRQSVVQKGVSQQDLETKPSALKKTDMEKKSTLLEKPTSVHMEKPSSVHMEKSSSGHLEKKSSIQKDVEKKPSSIQLERKDRTESGQSETGGLDTVIEVNEANASDVDFDRPLEVGEFVEDPPKIFSLKDILEPLTIESLNNAIYEMGVINLCWPEITEPVFETRTCFPESYYKNNNKERLLLAYAESFRRQYHHRYHKKPFYRKPLFLQAPNECGLQKMVCTSIRVTKLNYTGTNTWQGLAALVADYFVYEPLTQPMLHPNRLMSPYTALVRRAGNPFEIAHVLVSWLIGAGYDAYVVVGCAKRDTCLNLRYRAVCPELPDETEVVEEEVVPEEEPRYKLVPLPDFTSKYVKMMEEKAAQKIQDELDRIEAERQLRIKELELPPDDAIDGWRTHAWVLMLPGANGIEEPFFIEPAQGNAYPLDCEQYQQIDSVYNNENYYANLQTLVELEEEEWDEEEFLEKELKEAKEREERDASKKAKTEEEAKKRVEYKEKLEKDAAEKEKQRLEAKDEELQEQRAKDKKKQEHEEKVKKSEGTTEEVEELKKKNIEERERLAKQKEEEEKEGKKKKKKKKKKEEEAKVEEEVEEEEEPKKVVWQNLSHLFYDLNNIKLWEHLLPGEPFNRRQLVGIDYGDKRTAVETEKHLDMPDSWVEKLDISASDFEQRYPGCHKVIHYKKVLVDKYSRYSETTGIVKRITIFENYALTKPILTYEYYSNRDDKMHTVRIDHRTKWVRELFDTGRPDNLLKHEYALEAPVLSIEGDRTLEFKWYARLDQLEKVVCTPLTFEEFYMERADLLLSRHIEYTEPSKGETKRRLLNVTEIYKRNYNVPAKVDVWKRIFHIADNTIELLYHYEYNFVTNDTRNYIKPNLAETGGKILFYPDKTSGYIADPCAEIPRPLDVYLGLCNNIEWEYRTTKHVREYETDVNNYLALRHKELTEPTLYVSLFNTERNLEAQRGYFEQQRLLAEMAKRETEADADPLQPYIARMFGVSRGLSQPLTIKEATLVHEQCINDFKAKQLARQLLVQERFDTLNSEYKAKRLWYLANQFILTPEKEAAYFTQSAELSFSVHTLEVRLTRHKDLSAPRYRAMEAYLSKHPLLAEYNAMRAHRRTRTQV